MSVEQVQVSLLVHFHLSNNDNDHHVHGLDHNAKRMTVVLTLIMCEVKEQVSGVSYCLFCSLLNRQNKTNAYEFQYKTKTCLLVLLPYAHVYYPTQTNTLVYQELTSYEMRGIRARYCFSSKHHMCLSVSFRFFQEGCFVVGGTATVLPYDYEKASETSVYSLSGSNTQI